MRNAAGRILLTRSGRALALVTIGLLGSLGLAMPLARAAARHARSVPPGTIVYSTPGGRIYLADADGGDPRFLARGVGGSISPDGRTVAVLAGSASTSSRLSLVASATGRSTLVTRDAWGGARWAADSRSFAAFLAGPRRGGQPTIGDIITCARAPLRCSRVRSASDIDGFVLAPNGHRAAVGTLGERADGRPIFRVAIEGGQQPTRRLPAPYGEPWTWTRAGLLVSTLVTTPHQAERIALLRPDGTLHTLLTVAPGAPLVQPLDISPNGREVLYVKGLPCVPPHNVLGGCYSLLGTLEVGPAHGGAPRPISNDAFSTEYAAFNATGTAIVALDAGPSSAIHDNQDVRTRLAIVRLGHPGSPILGPIATSMTVAS